MQILIIGESVYIQFLTEVYSLVWSILRGDTTTRDSEYGSVFLKKNFIFFNMDLDAGDCHSPLTLTILGSSAFMFDFPFRLLGSRWHLFIKFFKATCAGFNVLKIMFSAFIYVVDCAHNSGHIVPCSTGSLPECSH